MTVAKSDYLPTTDSEFLAWLGRFATNVRSHLAQLGLSETALAALTSAKEDFRLKLEANAQANLAARQSTEEKKASRRAAESLARSLVRQIKAGSGYTDALGALLAVVGAEDGTDYASLKPDLTATDQGRGGVVLDFSKLRTDGVNIHAYDEAAGRYVFLARDTVAPYVDNRPLKEPGKPEIRRYKAVYVLGDEEIGLYSDEVVVTCSP